MNYFYRTQLLASLLRRSSQSGKVDCTQIDQQLHETGCYVLEIDMEVLIDCSNVWCFGYL